MTDEPDTVTTPVEPLHSNLVEQMDYSCRQGGRVPFGDELEDDGPGAELPEGIVVGRGGANSLRPTPELLAERYERGLDLHTGEPLEPELKRAIRAEQQGRLRGSV